MIIARAIGHSEPCHLPIAFLSRIYQVYLANGVSCLRVLLIASDLRARIDDALIIS